MVGWKLDQTLLETRGPRFWKLWKVLPMRTEMESLVLQTGNVGVYQRSFFNALLEESFTWKKVSDFDWDLAFKGRSAEGAESLSEWQEIEREREKLTQGNVEEVSQSLPLIRLVERIVNQAIDLKATDIHFEPMEEMMKVRFRMDGVLQNHHDLPHWLVAPLTSRLKIMASLNIAEKRLPQDGKISWQKQSMEYDLRVSSLPTQHGEKVVLRILSSKSDLVTWNQLGFSESMSKKVKTALNSPQGMIIVTGPTGSGKSSTLYAGLQQLNLQKLNVSTIEDPIEYNLSGANQVQINEKAGLTFTSALRSLLRQDPDVILVGEIRDVDTAKISIQAAQTGHLVLSTLHTNDAISAITRLRDLGVAPFLISSSLLGVLAQRLVRVLCPRCKVERDLKQEEKRLFPELSGPVFESKGCEACKGEGYKGRTAVFEWLANSENLQQLIEREATAMDLKTGSDWTPLREDALEKVRSGVTDIKEISRVILM